MPISTLQSGSFPSNVAIDTDTLVVDGVNNRVGIGTASPTQLVDIAHSGSQVAGAVRIGDPSSISSNTGIYMRTTGLATIGAAGGTIVFDTNFGSSEKVRIDSDGLKFNGDTAAANALDDYEEGTWLGTLKGLTSDPSSAVQATGTYTKIGRIVYVEIKFSNVSNVGASGNAYVIGIPFMPAISYASSGNCAAYLFDFPNGRTNISVQVATSGLFPYVSGDSVDWDVLKHAPGTGRYLEISAQYIVA